MTQKRMISQGECFYHIYNRIAGDPYDYPFEDEEKTKFLGIMKSLLKLHSPAIKVISYVIMGNHYHLILSYNSKVKISKATAQNCFFKYYESLGKEKVWDDGNLQKVVDRISSISSFVGHLQKQFSGWMNHVSRTKKYNCVYRGHLWAARFKCLALTDSESLRRCIVYAAFNPLRAKLVNDIGKYRFSSWGAYQQTRRHPHAENFSKYFLHDRDETKSDESKLKEAISYMQQLVDECITNECSLTDEEKEEAFNNALERNGIFKIVTRRVSHWTQGVIIGTKVKNMELAAGYYDAEKLAKRKMMTFKSDIDSDYDIPELSVFRNTLRKPKSAPS